MNQGEVENIERPENHRHTVLPIKEPEIYRAFKKAQELFWVDEEIDKTLVMDQAHWQTLDAGAQRLIKYILAFFAVSDSIVNESLTEEIASRIQTREIKLWYNYQIMIEDVHNATYSKLTDTYITNPVEKDRTFRAIENFPSIRKKIDWVRRWLGAKNDLSHLGEDSRYAISKLESLYKNAKRTAQLVMPDSDPEDEELEEFFHRFHLERPSLARQILINTIMEGIFFSASFAAIFWIYHIYRKLPGLSKANELISRDEGMHTQFGVNLYRDKMKHKLPEKEVHEIIAEAVDIETEFISEALPNDLTGMNAKLMTQYVQFVADQLLKSLGYRPYFGAVKPPSFDFMDKQSISVRIPDFFIDQDITEYGHHAAGLKPEEQSLDFSEDF